MPIKLPSETGWIDFRYSKSVWRVLVMAGSVEALPNTQYVDDEVTYESAETKYPAPVFTDASSATFPNSLDIAYVLQSLADKIGITPQELNDNSQHYLYVSNTKVEHPDPWLVATPNPWVEGGTEYWWHCYRKVTDEHWQACYCSIDEYTPQAKDAIPALLVPILTAFGLMELLSSILTNQISPQMIADRRRKRDRRVH